MPDHDVVSPEDWLTARKELLAREKEFSRLRDELSQQRRELPWTRVEQDYEFETPSGQESLAELFESSSQLIVYHFMFDPDWTEGCKACSFLADHYDPAIVHLRQRDVTMVTVSRAPLARLQTFQQRMGWKFKWVSSFGSDFNRDFHVTFTPEEVEQGDTSYNYATRPFPMTEAPGISVFYKDEAGDIFHTYSAYARGLDMFIGAYHLLDIAPMGRDEAELPYTMAWIRHHDRYGDETFEDPFVDLITK